MTAAKIEGRLHELDWARVVLVFGVFLHHVGMPFNGDEFVVMNDASSDLLDDVMVYFEQLRLPTLFMIAGAGGALLLARKGRVWFVKDKARRLFVPYLAGLLLVTPPQLYFAAAPPRPDYLAVYPDLAFALEPMHLWFIEYLFIFALLAAALYGATTTRTGAAFLAWIGRLAAHPCALMALGLGVVVLRVALKIAAPGDDKSIFEFSSSGFYAFFFAAGFLVVSAPGAWDRLATRFDLHALVFAALSVLFYAFYIPDLTPYAPIPVLWSIWWGLTAALSWLGALVILGGFRRFVRSTPQWLVAANAYIFPFYVIHQTVIVAFAALIVLPWDAGIEAKLCALFVLSLLGTIAVCSVLALPGNPLKALFGLRPRSEPSMRAERPRLTRP